MQSLDLPQDARAPESAFNQVPGACPGPHLRSAAPPEGTHWPATLVMVPWALLTLQTQVSTASHVLVQDWPGQAAPTRAPATGALCGPWLPGHPCGQSDDRGRDSEQAQEQKKLEELVPRDVLPWVYEQAAGFTHPPPPHRGPTSVGQVIC